MESWNERLAVTAPAVSGRRRRAWNANRVGHRGKDIDKLRQLARPRADALFNPGRPDDEGDSRSRFKVRELLPLSLLSERPSVVRVEHYQRIIGQALGIELVEDPPYLGVDPRDRGSVKQPPLLCDAIVDCLVRVRLWRRVLVRDSRDGWVERRVRGDVNLFELWEVVLRGSVLQRVSAGLVLCHITSHHITPHHITSHHIASHRIASHPTARELENGRRARPSLRSSPRTSPCTTRHHNVAYCVVRTKKGFGKRKARCGLRKPTARKNGS